MEKILGFVSCKTRKCRLTERNLTSTMQRSRTVEIPMRFLVSRRVLQIRISKALIVEWLSSM
ncbi:hypothetical protein U1Q18_016992 [Sarracenia purpurea var. burkii]